VPIIKTIALEKQGVEELLQAIFHQIQKTHSSDRHFWLLAQRAFYLIQQKRMKNVSKENLKTKIEEAIKKKNFNLYQFIKNYEAEWQK
jgi:LAO/AO transport system kinase